MKLYKYMHPDRTEWLQGGKFRFTQPICFNDPFEVLPAIREAIPVPGAIAMLNQQIMEQNEHLRQVFEQSVENGPFAALMNALPPEHRPRIDFDEILATVKADVPQFASEFLGSLSSQLRASFPAQTQDRFNRRFGILCLTEKPDNLLMWAHYADCHRGFAVELDGTHPFFDQRKSPNDLIRHLKKVSYAPERPQVTLFDPDAVPEEFVLSLVSSFFLTKSTEWEYEQEWRMILPVPEVPDPYTAMHLFPFPPTLVTGLVFGCRMPPGRKQGILELLDSGELYKHVAIYEASIDEMRFAVNVSPRDRTVR
jgi:hypothetical protein